MSFQEHNVEMFWDAEKQEKLLENLQQFIISQNYKAVVILCGNFLLWVNSSGKVIPCIPEMYETDGNEESNEALEICKQMDKEYFNTRFSYFSLKMGLSLFSLLHDKTNVIPQLLFSADDKYIPSQLSASFFAMGFEAIPKLYIDKLPPSFPAEEAAKQHLSSFLEVLYDHQHEKIYNPYLLSEKYLVRRFKARRESQTSYQEYNDFYHGLGAHFKSCSLEIFHLLSIISQNKQKLFSSLKDVDKMAMVLFVPDACVSSALQWWLAVSKTADDFDIINVTQNTTAADDVIMITHVSKWWVVRL